jgi:predicted acetyltransferase
MSGQTEPPTVEIVLARRRDRTALANMFQLYTHDFSEFWRGQAQGELSDRGLFEPYRPLDLYWREEGRTPLLLKLDGRLIGFALLNGVAHSGRPVDRNMAEFFIVRKHRRSGAGTAAAQGVFSRYPGQWEAAVIRPNLGALAFWRRAIGEHPQVEAIEETDHATAEWNGPILRFRIRPS